MPRSRSLKSMIQQQLAMKQPNIPVQAFQTPGIDIARKASDISKSAALSNSQGDPKAVVRGIANKLDPIPNAEVDMVGSRTARGLGEGFFSTGNAGLTGVTMGTPTVSRRAKLAGFLRRMTK